MNIRKLIFIILLAFLAFQESIFAENRNMTADEYMKMLTSENVTETTYEGLPLTPKDDKWGEPNNGLMTQLIPQSKEYIVGKPMYFGLVLKNTGDTVKEYDHQGISHNALIIINANNNEAYYKKGPFQTQGAPHQIDSGKIVTLFENRNIADEYVMTKPGIYTIQFRGGYFGSYFPASNIIRFEVKPGTPDVRDLLINSLVEIIPDANWLVMTVPKIKTPAGRKGAEGISIVLYRVRSRIRVILWKTESIAEVDKQSEDPQTSDYLGKDASGYFYITIPSKALDYWPTMKEDIIKALKIEDKSTDLKS
jgi:hypothetical protein